MTRRTSRTLSAAVITAYLLGTGVLASSPAHSEPATVPRFENGMAQSVFTDGQWIRQEAWVETSVDSDGDGKNDLIHIDVTRVPETETSGLKVPVIMELSPYFAGGTDVPNWSVDHEIGDPPASKPGYNAPGSPSTSPKISWDYEGTWVPRGFAVVHAESLGTGYSEGCPTTGAPNESLGGKAVVDWLNGRARAYTSPSRQETVSADWSTGSVGMIGTSYNGTLPIGVASTGVEGLDAIVPVSAISDWYKYYRSNGAVRAPGGYQGEDLDVLAEYVYTRPDQNICKPVMDDIRAHQDRVTGDYSPFWAERNYLAHADKITAATLIAHGLNDTNVMTENAADLYAALKANGTPHQIYLHQGEHGGDPSDDMLNRWFTRYLYHVENGVENLPKAYVQRENGQLTSYADWPDPAMSEATLNLFSARTTNGLGSLGFDKAAPGETESLVDDASIRAWDLANAPESPNRLLYRTGTLADDVRLSGTPHVSLSLAVDRPKANLTALLVEYPENSSPRILTRGWMDVENRLSAAITTPVVPGTFSMFDFDMEPYDYVVRKGSRIGLVVLSSDNEYTVRPKAGTTLTLDGSASSLTLPIVGGEKELKAQLGYRFPEGATPADSTEAQQRILDRKLELRESEITIDSFSDMGDSNQEAARNLKQVRSGSGVWAGQKYRDADRSAGSFFQLDMNVDLSAAKNYLGVKYNGGDAGRSFDVLVNGVKLKTETVTAAHGNTFYTQWDEIPASVLANITARDSYKKDSSGANVLDADGNKIPVVTVRFEANGSDSYVGGTYGITTARALTFDTDPRLTGLSFEEGTLTPAFSRDTAAYTLEVPYDATTAKFDADPAVPSGLVKIGEILIDDTRPRTVALNETGATTITLKAFAQDHTTVMSYTITVKKAAAPSPIPTPEPTSTTPAITDGSPPSALLPASSDAKSALAATGAQTILGGTLLAVALLLAGAGVWATQRLRRRRV